MAAAPKPAAATPAAAAPKPTVAASTPAPAAAAAPKPAASSTTTASTPAAPALRPAATTSFVPKPASTPAPAAAAAKPAAASPAKPAFGGGGEKCEGCGKRVYPNEKLAAQNKAWHKQCYKCTECNSVLTVNTGYAHNDKPYCKMHYTKLAGGTVRM